jgi:hypothetical protein
VTSVKRIIRSNCYACIAKLRNQSIELIDQQRWVSLSRGAKLLLDPEMHLHAARPEPDSAAMHEVRRLRDLRNTQQASIELPRVVLMTCRHRELHVVDSQDGHLVVVRRWFSSSGGSYVRCVI